MSKKKVKKKKQKFSFSQKFLTKIAWTLSGIIFLLSSFLGGYYFGFLDAKQHYKKELEKKDITLNSIKKEKLTLKDELKAILNKEQKNDITAKHEISDYKALEPIKNKQKHHTKKPKLAIIFDDVSFASQVKAIKSLNIPVTMSFFPYSPIHPNTPKLASKEKIYMIHLPMEAMHFNKEETKTLRVSDSIDDIKQRIKEIKKDFPRVKYINNHTGSKFTSNYIAVKKLIKVLDDYDITFIDSRTTAQTKVPKVMKLYGKKYIARDVFLDHKGDVESIKKQIKEAIRISKKYGLAIAIGHPHKNTIKALKESKYLLKDVDLIYVNQL